MSRLGTVVTPETLRGALSVQGVRKARRSGAAVVSCGGLAGASRPLIG